MDQLVPISLFTDLIVLSGLGIACRLATSPTSTSPSFANATTEGVVRLPSALAITVGSPPSRTATTEFVVPRSIPTAFAIVFSCSVLFSTFLCSQIFEQVFLCIYSQKQRLFVCCLCTKKRELPAIKGSSR